MSSTQSNTSAGLAGRFWSVAARAAAALVVLMSGVNAALRDTGFGNGLEFLGGIALGVTAIAACLALLVLLALVLKRVPFSAALLITASLIALAWLFQNSPSGLLATALNKSAWSLPAVPDAFSPGSLSIIALAIACLAATVLMTLRRKALPLSGLVLLSAALGAIAVVLVTRIASDGADPFTEDGLALLPISGPLALEDPSQPGAFAVESFTYGAGENKRRPEFADGRALSSRTVDATRLLPDWKGFKASQRERYWGFGLREAPLNGRVWMPQGPGTFPLVLIVHGNHGMEDYSDDGYAYLGELLASRGLIAVSVDQNFINGSWSGDFRGREMAARAWFLLEHLALWRDWNQTQGHRLFDRVDMQNLALIGHSRGGEAVSIAHRFNSLPYFPDDATVAFDYGFNIRSLVAIAQVDQRYHRRVELEDVNFFTIHGSYDSDEPAYHGLRQMNRISFSARNTAGESDSSKLSNSDNSSAEVSSDYYLKAGVYLHGANHGQFNTGWGRTDFSPPGSWRLNTAPIIPGEEQRQAAKVFISAFLELTLRGQADYAGVLRDPRRAASWLPPRTFVHQFNDSSFRVIADFEEDIDVTTTTKGTSITAENLLIWREEPLEHRDERLQGSNAVVVGWGQANAALELGVESVTGLSKRHALVFAVSGSTESLPQSTADGTQAGSEPGARGAPVMPDFSVELSDLLGHRVSVPVSSLAQLMPPVRVQYLKNQAQNKRDYKASWEPVLQYVELPLRVFAELSEALDLTRLAKVRFVFDQSEQGIIILDDIGVALVGETRPNKAP